MSEGFNIRGEPWVATERDCTMRWGVRDKPAGHVFRCAWCGHRFVVGDVVRCIYTNGPGEDTKGIGGNPFCCDACHCPRPELLAKLRAMHAETVGRLWWFVSRWQD